MATAEKLLKRLDFQEFELVELINTMKSLVEDQTIGRLFEDTQPSSTNLKDLKQKIETLSFKKSEYLAEILEGHNGRELQESKDQSDSFESLESLQNRLKALLNDYKEKSKLLSTLEQVPANLELAKLELST